MMLAISDMLLTSDRLGVEPMKTARTSLAIAASPRFLALTPRTLVVLGGVTSISVLRTPRACSSMSVLPSRLEKLLSFSAISMKASVWVSMFALAIYSVGESTSPSM
ncbi:MAG: hypothetical protein KGQ87_03735 [Verrucomicrobia bacterium]|nr:hypothetical protein [Verrucomicrobiota bacterium]